MNESLHHVHTPVQDRPTRVLLCHLACGTSLPPFTTHTAVLLPLNASAFPASSSHAGSVRARVLSRVRLLVTPWAVARRAPLSTWILQARILEWVVTSFSRGSSDPGIEPESLASLASALAGSFFSSCATGAALMLAVTRSKRSRGCLSLLLQYR